ncbi:MAG TPA: hypothetical protein VK960_06045 [Acidimicrobiia bacterium]|nr:hypothetical protein [Acidimicrobiia bacterium]
MHEESLILDVTPGDATFDTRFLEPLGHPVLVCHGPGEGSPCPIVESTCSKVDSAHGIVFQLDLDRSQHREILRRYQEVVADDIPILASVRPGQDEAYRDLLAGVHVVVGEPGAADLDGFAARVEASDRTR